MSNELKFEAADLEGLSPEERAALMDEVGDEAPADEAAPAGEAEGAPEPEAVGDAAADEAAPAGEAEGDAEGATEDAAADDATAADAAPAPQHPAPYTYALPAEFAERAKALQERQAELEGKLTEGELDATQFIMAQRELAREQAKLDAMQFKAEMAAEMQHQAMQRAQAVESNAWGRAVQDLAVSLGEGAPDYLNSEADGMALAQQARAIMVARGVPEGVPVADKLSILQQAHKMVLLARGQDAAPAPAAKPQDAKAAAMAARKVDMKNAPVSLGATPGADSGSTEAFARLEELDGEKLEAAVAKLARTDPAAYERWLAAA